MMIFQIVFLFKKPKFVLYGWSLGVSFSAMLYAIGVFLEYNFPPGPVTQWAGRLEWAAIVFLIHFLYGFTFAYFKIDAKRYHQLAGFFHLILMFLIWRTDLLIADRFVTRHFTGLSQPYIEPALGPLGSCFVAYGFLACLCAIVIWLRHKDPFNRYKGLCLSGIAFWMLLGFHDGMASIGMPTFQYLMEYGFFVFSGVVLWIVLSRFYEMLSEDKYRTVTEFLHDGILVIQNETAVFENPACRSLFGQSVIGCVIQDFSTKIAINDKEKFLRFYDSLMNSGTFEKSATVCIEKDDGKKSIVEINASAIHYNNGNALFLRLSFETSQSVFAKKKHARKMKKRLLGSKKWNLLGCLPAASLMI